MSILSTKTLKERVMTMLSKARSIHMKMLEGIDKLRYSFDGIALVEPLNDGFKLYKEMLHLLGEIAGDLSKFWKKKAKKHEYVPF